MGDVQNAGSGGFFTPSANLRKPAPQVGDPGDFIMEAVERPVSLCLGWFATGERLENSHAC